MSNTDTIQLFQWARVRKLVLKSIIGAVIAAAAIAIYAVIVGEFSILAIKLLMLVALFVAFTLLSLFDAEVIAKRDEHFALAGVLVNVYLLLGGVLKIMVAHGGTRFGGYGTDLSLGGYGDATALGDAFGAWVLLVLIARSALGLAQLVKAEGTYYRYNALTVLTRGTYVLLGVLAGFVSFPILFNNITYPDVYWRLTGVTLILVVLGFVLIPLLGRFFGERLMRPQPVARQTKFSGVRQDNPPVAWGAPVPKSPEIITNPVTDAGHIGLPQAQQAPTVRPGMPRRLAWPRFEDGTPLPQGPDGKPDYSVLNG